MAQKKILIISPSWLGDIIMAQSLLKTIKEHDQNAIITMYAPQYAHPIIKRMKEVSNIITNPFDHGELNLIGRFKEGQALKNSPYGPFDEVYVLPNSLKSALVPFFARIPIRIGMKGESRYILLNRIRHHKNNFKRMVERYVSLYYLTTQDKSINSSDNLPTYSYPKLTSEKVSNELLERLNIRIDRPLLVIGCGANYGPSKLWPVEYFAEVASIFTKRGGAILALGTKKDEITIQKVYENFIKLAPNDKDYFYNCAGKTNLTEALDLINLCHAGVCNDSGLMHTIASLDIPQVCLFGSTSTIYTPPLSNRAICIESTQDCHPCFKRECRYQTYACQKELSVDKVIDALKQLGIFTEDNQIASKK